MRGVVEAGKMNIGFIDGQWGSSGKGKFNGTLALEGEIDFAISQNSVNASHIFVWNDGREYKFQHLPTSIVNDNVVAILGAGASIDLSQLLKEISDWGLGPDRLLIHPNAVVITPDDIEWEKKNLLRIASTMTGNGAAAARKIMRHPNTRTAADYKILQPYIKDTYEYIIRSLELGRTGILETAQGFDLSVDHGMHYTLDGCVQRAYPYTTSRNVDPLTFAGMSGIPHKMLGNVLLNLRTFPIRVGDGSNNTQDGLHKELDMSQANSGMYYPDQDELSWEDITDICGSQTDICELTSLTKRKRRVFNFSLMQLHHITRIVQPTHISINFVNYIDDAIRFAPHQITMEELHDQYPKVAKFVELVDMGQYWYNTPYAGKVFALGTGPRLGQWIEIV